MLYRRHCRLEVLLAPLRAGATHVVLLGPVGDCPIGQRCPPSAHPRCNGRRNKRSQLDLHDSGLHLLGVADGQGVGPGASRVAKVSACGLSGPYDWVKCSFGFVPKPYRATTILYLWIGHVIGGITMRCGHGRQCSDDDVECDVSERIIFGPDNAYLRDQSAQRFQSQTWIRAARRAGIARRHIASRVRTTECVACRWGKGTDLPTSLVWALRRGGGDLCPILASATLRAVADEMNIHHSTIS